MSRFKEAEGRCVLILSLKVGAVGLNLTCASRVILFDRWWNPSQENQAIDRVHRLGQQKPVQVICMSTADTIEERILALQEKKQQLVDSTLGSQSVKDIPETSEMRFLVYGSDQAKSKDAHRAKLHVSSKEKDRSIRLNSDEDFVEHDSDDSDDLDYGNPKKTQRPTGTARRIIESDDDSD